MENFSSVRPNTGEHAPQGVQSCKAYILSPFAFRSTASWGAQYHNAVISGGFVCIRCTMVTCDCVSCGTPRAAFSCALGGQKNTCMDLGVPKYAPTDSARIRGIFHFFCLMPSWVPRPQFAGIFDC